MNSHKKLKVQLVEYKDFEAIAQKKETAQGNESEYIACDNFAPTISNTDFVLVSQKCETNNPKNLFIGIIDHALKLDIIKKYGTT